MKQRPMATLIFGILSIGLALLSVASPVMQAMAKALNTTKTPNPVLDAMNADPDFMKFSHFATGVSIAFGVALLTFGIGLLLLRNWARLGLIIYSIAAIVYSPVSVYITYPVMVRGMEAAPHMTHGMATGITAVSMGFALLIGMGYAGLLLYYMTRQNVIDACNPDEADPAPAP